MAKPKSETALATVEQTAQTALATYDDLREAEGLGQAGIDRSKLRPPRLSLCQSGTPQRKHGNPKQIENLDEAMYFNPLSGEIYGRTVDIVIIKHLGTTYIQFKPGELGKVLDFNVPAGDPRTRGIEKMVDGKRTWTKPIATEFVNYLVFIPKTGEIVTLSFKSTGLPAAKAIDSLLAYPLRLNGQLFMKPPTWARTFQLSSAPKSEAGNDWHVPSATYTQVTPEATRAICRQAFDDYAKFELTKKDYEEAETIDAEQPNPADDSIPF
ncbi:MAG TPA: hypothetical protein VJS19_13935 [Candidatus Dormibacteraeota bacterium]|nr:hypothetical protein [Candidatus Dormibacteraeota bacterium]